MGIFRVPRKKTASRPPRTTSDIIRGKQQEIRLKERDVTLTLSWRDIERALIKKRRSLLAVVGALVLILGINHFAKTFASIAELSPTSCLGGWENPANASGQPDATSLDPEAFTTGNSAVLKSGSASELYCGSFTGSIPEETIPKSLNLRISWVFKESSGEPTPIISTSTLIEEATTTEATATSTEETSPEVPAGSEEPTTSPAPEPEKPPSSETPTAPAIEESTGSPSESPITPIIEESTGPSAWNIAPRAFAAEGDIETSTTTENASTSTEIIVDPQNDLLDITYTLDGTNWQSLGHVTRDNWQTIDLVIPSDSVTDWNAVQKIQIGIKSLSTTGDEPTIYLDGMTLSVEYENIPKPEAATSTDPEPTFPEEATTTPSNVSYSRFPGGTTVTSPLTINFSFKDWQKDMDFVDVFGNTQNYWWIEANSASSTYASPCYPSSTISAAPSLSLPAGRYSSITINAAATLENCENTFGGRLSPNKPYGESVEAGSDIFIVQ